MEDDAELVVKGQYQRIIGKLIYLANTRPNIAHAVGVVSQFMHQPQVHHLEVAMRIIRYLKKTPCHGVVFRRNGHLETQIYTDASWAEETGDRKSTSGFFSIVGGNLVAWKSKKQKVVSLSKIEFPPKESIQILCDNAAAIAISENPVQHDRTKHVEIDRHFIREKLDAEIISLPSIRSEDQLADILTKSVNGRFFSEVLDKLNIGNPTVQLAGEC
ncbi:secreted RxLR effector protein 161-like [Rutidosis leptorrhynchoides]|uniref:secreted RxLR effector protein 161-like n=1 Tax=Rutidosis leptorrhynchoides TaxID=125765 RepID=UPI003A992348